MPVKSGAAAPDATVFIAPKQPVRLHDLIDAPTLLLFFPLAFTSVCTKELCTVAEDFTSYSELGAKVYAISVDSPNVNAKFAAACNATYPFLSDFNREAATAFGVLRPELNGLRHVSERAAFIVDAQYVVRYAWVGEHPGVMPDFDAIRQALRTLDTPASTPQSEARLR
jgi:glutaredoxin-dependent peroxiredoxin